MALPRTAYDDRRTDIRLAGGGAIDAIVLDAYQFPTATLHAPQVENVSAGGMAISTTTENVPVGSHIKVMLAGVDSMETPGVVLEVLNTAATHDGRVSLHCRVLEGTVPAALIFRW